MKALLSLLAATLLIFSVSAGSCLSNTLEIRTGENSYLAETSPYESFPDITPFCLGCVNNPSVVEEFGKFMGKYFAGLGISAVAVAVPGLLEPGKYDDGLFGTSPFLAAETVKNLSTGLLSAGIMPFLDASQGFSDETVEALLSRKMYLPLMIENDTAAEKLDHLKEFGLPLFNKNGETVYLEQDLRFPDWGEKNTYVISKEEIIKYTEKILLKATVMIKKTRNYGEYELVSNVPPQATGNKAVFLLKNPYLAKVAEYGCVLLIHSDRESVLDAAAKIAAGLKIAEGRRNW